MTFAFKRNEREFFNFKLFEQPNGHFGNTIVKLFMLSAYNSIFYSELSITVMMKPLCKNYLPNH